MVAGLGFEPRSQDYESCKLPLLYPAIYNILAGPLRFELRSYGFGDRDNNHYTKDLYINSS